MAKKCFYAAVIDAYEYSEVTEKRYKNFVDFAIEQWGEEEMEHQLRNYLFDYAIEQWNNEEMEHQLRNHLEGTDDEIDWRDFFDDYYGYTTHYFALDEDGNELEDLEDNNVTLNEFWKKHNLI